MTALTPAQARDIASTALSSGLLAPPPRPSRSMYGHALRLPGLPSIKECRSLCICIACRRQPAMFYGPTQGYGVKCEACIERRRRWCGRVRQ